MIGQMHGLVLVDLGRIDIDMNDRAVFAELLDFAGDAVVEPHAEGEEQIRAWQCRCFGSPLTAQLA